MSALAELVRTPVGGDLKVEVMENVDEDVWDGRVRSVSGGTYKQTTMFNRHQTERSYEKGLYFKAVDDAGEVVGQLSTRMGAPFAWGLRRRPFAQVTLPLFGAMAPCMRWGDGPIILTRNSRKEVYAALVCRAINEGVRRGCISIEAWPAFYGDDFVSERDWILDLYAENGFQVASQSTLVVDLRKGEDGLWSGIRKEARTKVRKARDQGVEILELDGDEGLLLQAHNIVRETAARNEVACWPLEEMRLALQYHGSRGVFRAFLARHEGRGVAYQNVTCFNRSALLGGVAYSDYSRQARVYGNDLMQWHVMQAMREMGTEWLDYGGAEPNSEDPKMKGIYQFKAKWGGQLVAHDQCRLIVAGGRRFSAKGLVSRIHEKTGDRVYGRAKNSRD